MHPIPHQPAPDADGHPAPQGSEEEHSPPTASPEGKGPEGESAYLESALVTAGAVAAENSDPDTAAGASAPLSKPALASAPQGEDGPLVSDADPTSNAG